MLGAQARREVGQVARVAPEAVDEDHEVRAVGRGGGLVRDHRHAGRCVSSAPPLGGAPEEKRKRRMLMVSVVVLVRRPDTERERLLGLLEIRTSHR